MDIALHAGAHFTEEERLMKCLLRNKELWAPLGISVPGPSRYRSLLRDTLIAMGEAEAATDAREILLDAILDQEVTTRMVLSHPHLFGVAHAVVKDGVLYPEAAGRLARLDQLFALDRVKLFFGIRNPATFLPLALDRAGQTDMAAFMQGTDPRSLRWSDTITAMQQAAPSVQITVWCNEDAPLIWESVMRAIAGSKAGQEMAGTYDVALDLMPREGRRRFRTFLGEHPGLDEVQRRRVTGLFLEKYAIDDAMIEEVDLPGWSMDLIADLTDIYEQDMHTLRALPNVRLIEP